MKTILGIDLGTSSIKAMLLDIDNGVLDVAAQSYTVSIPHANYAEQAPEMWWDAAVTIFKKLKEQHGEAFDSIAAVGFSGQMHGLVITDEHGIPLRPAIIWLDQRSEKQLEEMNQKLRLEEMAQIFHNRAFTGFAFPSLLWVKENEPDIFRKTYKLLHPKDYIRLKMTGNFGTDTSDASASLAFDVGKRDWAWDILKRFELPESIFPACHEATEIAGYITEECAKETGLRAGIPVIYGSGDQPAQSIGNGAVREGLIISNIGTGGQISTYSKKDVYDSGLRTHTFCHSIDKAYTVYGAALCSGMSLNWLKNKVLHIKDYKLMSNMAGEIDSGSDGLIYLPYLSGERTPHMNPKARGMFFGLQLRHDNRHIIRSVMEGVAFSLKDSLQIFDEIGIKGNRIIASGGGASSDVWLQIQADIFEKEVHVSCVKEQACLGACIMAGAGTGIFGSIQEACNRYITFDSKVYYPNMSKMVKYRTSYEIYQELYSRTKDLFEAEVGK
ncbi:xylulokinase [Caproiciproducens galactitolivorans]|uniref:Xylulose kinase n=1 Tax=Caproiciproducens galactitolivorans TaxID=642589 RepID=A0A4Z0YDC2_9FIRM|nr:xylulokinase [Caproiciproducens galactitolivorans]QEY35529.1 xylulokinase [Caproiciproducens galactitolivorans]TGJ77251.1 xylulose kinase [Caproiciproducens galactitolivorans]